MASQIWRIQGIDTGGAPLELSRIVPWDRNGAAVPSTVSSTFPCVEGSIDDLLVDDASTCTFAAADVLTPAFSIAFTFDAAVDLWGFRYAGPSANTWLRQHQVAAGTGVCSLGRVQWRENDLSPAPRRGVDFLFEPDKWEQRTAVGSRNWEGCAMSSDGQTMLVGSESSYLWLSSDGGQTWVQQTAAGSFICYGCGCSSDGKVLLAAVYGGNLRLSTSSGQTWLEVTAAGSRSWTRCAVSADGKTLLAAGAGGQLWLSTDKGSTWAQQSTGVTASWNGAAVSGSGRVLLAAPSSGYLQLSTDGGLTWTQLTAAGSRTWRGCAVSADGQVLFATAQNSYLWLSTDGGLTWTQPTAAGARNWYAGSVSGDGLTLIAAAASHYLWLSTDGGQTWVSQTDAGSRDWRGCACSVDGGVLLGAAYSSYPYMRRLSDPTYLANKRSFQVPRGVVVARGSVTAQQGKLSTKTQGALSHGDPDLGGSGTIYGSVGFYQQAGNIPLSRRVRLYRSRDSYLVRETWSNADGSYEFTGISGRYEYDVIAWDHEMQFRSVVANNLVPEVMP